jgi:cytoskeletal protein CcmA (bactofilin family)
MWRRNKPELSRAAGPEPRDSGGNQPPDSVSSSNEGVTKVNKDVMRPVGASANPGKSWVSSGLQVKGEISGIEDLLIDGSVEGLVQLDGRNLTVGTTANVEADVIAGEVVIYGRLKGNIRAACRIEIKKEGSVTGDLTTLQILIEDGAYFKGTIQIEKRMEKDAHRNAFPPAA